MSPSPARNGDGATPHASSKLVESLWPAWRSERILYQDDALLVVDKPAGVPCMAARPEESADDVASRLRRHLGSSGDDPVYVGIHHRLDRDTSGLMVFARSKEANPTLAHQFETHRIERRYVAAVELPEASSLPASVDLPLRRARDHRRMEPAPAEGHGARAARTDILDVRSRGRRALLRVAPRTGRTHQIRVHLAALGAPVAGDRLYGGPGAPRLMLHAVELALRHPIDDTPLRFHAPLPDLFECWLHERDEVDPRNLERVMRRLQEGLEARWGLAHSCDGPRSTTAFRLLHGEGEGVPGLALDRYGDFVLIRVDEGLLPQPTLATLAERLGALGFQGVYLQQRPRRPERLSPERLAQLAPPNPVHGAPAPRPLLVLEEGLPLEVALGQGLATGLYMDQREARRWLRARCSGADVLNLFGYTGAFTVAAAAGGARRTVTVDASAPALRWARRNLALGGYGGTHQFVRGDVFETLEVMRLAAERFDFVVLDPPTYGTSRRGRWRAQRDWPRLIEAACQVLAPGGWIYASSNDRRSSARALQLALQRGVEAAGRRIEALRRRAPPADHPHPATVEPHLNAWLCRVR